MMFLFRFAELKSIPARDMSIFEFAELIIYRNRIKVLFPSVIQVRFFEGSNPVPQNANLSNHIYFFDYVDFVGGKKNFQADD